MSDWQIITGDCLEILPTIPAGSIDAVIADPPYGTTACAWDSVIPLGPMWAELKRVIRPRGAICLFAGQPFTSALIMSNAADFRYSWIWQKSKATGYFDAKIKPMKEHEDICIFGQQPPVYFPQIAAGRRHKRNEIGGKKTQVYGEAGRQPTVSDLFYPRSILHFKNAYYTDGQQEHPTQKPIALMCYLIRTYTNAGETVLDFTAGSGSTGVAAILEGRRFIGIELDPAYAEIARRRCRDAAAQPPLFTEAPAPVPPAEQPALLGIAP